MRARGAAAATLLRAGPLAAAALVASEAILLVRLVPDVRGKPLFEDEAVAGLIAARPLGSVLATVWDRGGAPAHFVLAHGVLAVWPSPDALRWLSIVCALAAVPASFDLARRLAGPVSGAVAALTVATSAMLGVYGTFGRMYALLALASAVAADLFVVALRRPSPGRAAAAGAGAWLVAAVHPYGAFFAAAEGLVALALWRGRPRRAALPAAITALALAPLAVLDLRLAHRFEVGVGGDRTLAGPAGVRHDFVHALGGFAGGHGLALVAFAVAAAAGLVVTARTEPAYAAFVVLAVGSPLALLLVTSSGRHPDLSPRHLIYGLPLYASLVGVAAARALERLPPAGWAVAVAAVAAAALVTAGGIRDPRDATYLASLSTHGELRAPAAWLRRTVRKNDVLYPFSAVFFAALPETARAVSLPRAQPPTLVRAARRIADPSQAVFVAVPVGAARLEPAAVRGRLGPGFTVRRFGAWLLVRAPPPHRSSAAVLRSADAALASVRAAGGDGLPAPVAGYLRFGRSVLCAALRSLGAACEPA